jgi:hypothetical protein
MKTNNRRASQNVFKGKPTMVLGIRSAGKEVPSDLKKLKSSADKFKDMIISKSYKNKSDTIRRDRAKEIKPRGSK